MIFFAGFLEIIESFGQNEGILMKESECLRLVITVPERLSDEMEL